MKKFLLIAKNIFLLLIAAIIISSITIFLYVRSPSGLSWIHKKINYILKKQGLNTHVVSIKGSLPEHLYIEGLEITTHGTILFTAKLLEIRINPWSLFQGIIDITSCTITNPSLRALPIQKSSLPFSPPDLSFFENVWWLSRLKIHTLSISEAFFDKKITGTDLLLSLQGTRTNFTWDALFNITSPTLPPIHGTLKYTRNSAHTGPKWLLTSELQSNNTLPSFSGMPTPLFYATLTISHNKNSLLFEDVSVLSGPWTLTTKNLSLAPNGLHGVLSLTHSAPYTPSLPIGETNCSLICGGTLRQPIFTMNLFIQNFLMPKPKHIQLQTHLSCILNLLGSKATLSTKGTACIIEEPLQNKKLSHTIDGTIALEHDTFTIETLSIISPISSFTLSGMLKNTENFDTQCVVHIPEIQNIKPFIDIQAFSGSGVNIQDLSGSGHCTTQLSRKQNTTITGTTSISLKNMHWGTPVLQGLLGTTAQITTNFKILMDKYLQCTFNPTLIKTKHLGGKGSIYITKKRIDSALAFAIDDLSITDLPLSGSLEAFLKTRGSFFIPDITLTAHAPNLKIQNFLFGDTRICLSTILQSKTPQGITGIASCTTKINTQDQENISSTWELSPHTLTVNNITGSLLGIKMTGSFGVTPATKILSGTLKGIVSSWKYLENFLNIPLSGDAQATLSFMPQRAQNFSVLFQLSNISIAKSLYFSDLQGTFSTQNRPQKSSLSLYAQMGKGFYKNLLSWDKGTINTNGELHNINTKVTIEGPTSIVLDAETNLHKNNITISTFRFMNSHKNQGFQIDNPATITFLPSLYAIKHLNLSFIPSGKATLDITRLPQKIAIHADLTSIPLSIIQVSSLDPTQGFLTGDIHITGTPQNPKGNVSFSIEDLQLFPQQKVPLKIVTFASLTNTAYTKMNVTTSIYTQDSIPQLTIDASLPCSFSDTPLPHILKKKPFTLDVHWTGDLADIWSIVPTLHTSISGKGHLRGSLLGTLENPEIQLEGSIVDAEYEDIAIGIYLNKINLTISSLHQKIFLKMHASDSKQGALSIIGTIGTLSKNAPLSLTGTYTNLSPSIRKDLNITFSGETLFKGTIQNPILMGTLTITDGNLQLTNNLETSIPTIPITEQVNTETYHKTIYFHPPTLDITINIPNHFFVRTNKFDSEWRGTTRIQNSIVEPTITGNFSSTKGKFSFLGKTFTLTKGTILLTGSQPPNPALNIQFNYKSPNLSVVTLITGTTNKPKVSLTSIPPLPKEEIVSHVLFGKNIDTLTRVQTIQLAQEVTSIAGLTSGNTDLLSIIREKIHFDVVRISSVEKTRSASTHSSEEIPVLELGKYLTDTIYIAFEQGLDTASSGVRIEIELMPNINLEGRTSINSDEIGLSWKKDY